MSNLNMTKLDTIQKREKLNEIFPAGDPGPGGAYHSYEIYRADGPTPETHPGYCATNMVRLACIDFQNGPRAAQDSFPGVCDQDLLEIVRDRLKAFQAGPYACFENARALMHIEQALLQLNERVEDRIKRGVLGTMEK